MYLFSLSWKKVNISIFSYCILKIPPPFSLIMLCLAINVTYEVIKLRRLISTLVFGIFLLPRYGLCCCSEQEWVETLGTDSKRVVSRWKDLVTGKCITRCQGSIRLSETIPTSHRTDYIAISCFGNSYQMSHKSGITRNFNYILCHIYVQTRPHTRFQETIHYEKFTVCDFLICDIHE